MKAANVTSKFQVWVSKVSQVPQRQQISFESDMAMAQFHNFQRGIIILNNLDMCKLA